MTFGMLTMRIIFATHSDQKPKNESIRKWNGAILEFLEQRQMKIIAKNDSEIKFKPQESG